MQETLSRRKALGLRRRRTGATSGSADARKMTVMRLPPRWLVVAMALAAVAAVLRFVVLRPAPVAVEVALVQTGLVEETVTNTRAGTVKSRRRAKLSPQMGGRVVELPYRKGATVAAGALLLRLDDTLQQAQLQLAREDLHTATARAEEACLAATLAEREWRRGAALAADGITSVALLDTLETARDRGLASCRAARAATEQAEASVRLFAAELAFTELRAPFAGIVADCGTEVGEWITPSPPGVPIPAVLDLLDPASIYITAPIDEVDAERVKVGQEVRIQIDSRPGEHFVGALVRVAPYVLDVLEQNRTVEVEAELTDATMAVSVLPGTSADLEVILSRREAVLRVPTAAVAEGGKVLVLANGRLQERVVTTGLRNWQFTEAAAGLSAGELVVTARNSTEVKPGARAVAAEAAGK
jgi:HlyD family secretion protein